MPDIYQKVGTSAPISSPLTIKAIPRSLKMHPFKVLSTLALLAIGVLASPAPVPGKPPRPPPPPPSRPAPTPVQLISQSNVCGNNVSPYCCSSVNGGSVTCSAIGATPLFSTNPLLTISQAKAVSVTPQLSAVMLRM